MGVLLGTFYLYLVLQNHQRNLLRQCKFRKDWNLFLISQLLEGMQAGVGAVIASVVYEMAAGVVCGKNPVSILIMAGAFAATCFFGVNVVYVVLACGLIGVVRTIIERKGEKK